MTLVETKRESFFFLLLFLMVLLHYKLHIYLERCVVSQFLRIENSGVA